MRTSVVSFTKKIISMFFAAVLAIGLLPVQALAASDSLSPVPEGDEGAVSIASSAEGGDADVFSHCPSDESLSADGVGAATPSEDGSDADDERTTTTTSANVINQTMPLEVVAQQESTRSYFLAQTLESTKTVPIVSANLPLDKGTNQGPQAGADGGTTVGSEDKVTGGDPSVSTEGDGGSEPEEGDDSDESDLGGGASNDGTVAPGVSSESTVVGSFTYLGMSFAVETGGESVALVAVDYSKLPEEFVQKQILVVPDAATPDGMDYYSVTRIAANAFSSLTKDNANPDHTGCIELFSDEELLAEAGLTPEDVKDLVAPNGSSPVISSDSEKSALPMQNGGAVTDSRGDAPAITSSPVEPATEGSSDNAIRTIASMEGNVATLDDGSTYTFANPLEGCTGILAAGLPATITNIEEDAFAGFETLQYLVVAEDNPDYATYDGVLYNIDKTELKLIPEGRGGAIRLVSSAPAVDSEELPHGSSVDTLVVYPDEVSVFSDEVADASRNVLDRLFGDECSYFWESHFGAAGISADQLARSAAGSEGSIVAYWKTDEQTSWSTAGLWHDQASGVQSRIYFVQDVVLNLITSEGYITLTNDPGEFVWYSTSKYGPWVGPMEAGWRIDEVDTFIYIILHGDSSNPPETGKSTVTWDTSGASASITTTNYGSRHQSPTEGMGSTQVSLSGWTLEGWYTNAECTEGRVAPGGTTPAITSDTTYYAKWQRTITFNPQNGSGATSVTAVRTAASTTGAYTTPAAPSRSNWTFKGWTTSATGTSYTNANTSTTNSASAWCARWEMSVTLNANGGTLASGVTSPVKALNAAISPFNSASAINAGIPTRAGHTFNGWRQGSATGTRVDANGTIAAGAIGGNQTLYAAWTPTTYSITWNMQNHGTAPTKTSYTYGESYTLPTVSATGYAFGGWYIDSNCTTPASNITSTTTGNKTFYAKWTANSYSITWNMQGHGTAPAKSSYTYGDSYTLPSVADVTGWTFGGWYTNSTCTTKASDITSTTTGDKTFYAKWTLNSHKVSWRYDGAEGKTDSEEKKEYNATFTMKEPGSKPGYSFAGWKATGADTNTYAQGVSFTMPDGDVVFTAQWSKSAYTKVNLADTRLQEGIGEVWHWPDRGYVESESSTVVKGKGERIVAPPVVDGYEFLGWYDVADQNESSDAHRMIDASGNLFTETAPSATTTWYAHWKRVSCPVVLAAEYDSILYVTEKGDEGVPHARFGEAFSSSAEGGRLKVLPHRTGHTFMGYYTERNPKVSTSAASEGAFEGTRWIDAQGNLSQDVWNLYPTEERGSITLYAAWRLDDCRVSFDATGGLPPNTEPVVVMNEGALAERVWNYGEPKGYLPVASGSTFSRNGYSFCGWYFEEGGERVFVSDAEGNPTPDKWMFERGSVVLRPAWTAKGYTLLFDPAYPDVAGMPSESPEPTIVELSYDDPLDLASLAPSFGAFSFAGWYDESERSFEGAHMTDGRFTPRGSLVAQDPIRLHARWNEPGRATYTLYVGTPDGTELVSERPFEYRYTETIAFNGTEAPEAPEGHRFVGWVEVASDAEARALIAQGGPGEDAVTTPGFGPLSSRNLFFVAKWGTVPLSTTLRSAPSEDGSSWLLPTDRLVDFEREGAIPWSGACEAADVSRPELARSLSYDVAMEPFALPDVVRKGHVFAGWRKAGSSDVPERGLVVEPSRQIGSVDSRDLVYAPVFEEAFYTIVLDGNGYGEDVRFEDVAYGDSFSFPYPATLQTGSCFAAWASAPTTASSATETFFPDDEAPLAPSYDEAGQPTSFGLAQLADEDNVIALYAVWNAPLSVEVPLFANMAVDTESGDVIAGANALRPIDANVRYRVESVRCEPVLEEGRAPFEGTDGVFLSVYAGLSLPSGDGAERDLLRAANVGEGGEVSYADASGATRTAKPLLIALGGEAASLWTRTAPEGSPSLESVTDADVPCGFIPFDARSPLTVRYGIWAEDASALRAHAHGSGAAWTLPDNDGANVATSDDPRDPSYGKREDWSSESVPVARLRYTVGLL